LNLSHMRSIDLSRSLSKVNLLNLEFLNINGNDLSCLEISNHNFPKLKEIYATHNHFSTPKYFSKLDSLKLLDLGFNEVMDLEELVCLAFLENLIVLNIARNPVSSFPQFD